MENQNTQKIVDLDAYLDGKRSILDDIQAGQPQEEQQQKKQQKYFNIAKQFKNTAPLPISKEDDFNLPSTSDALTANAKRKLENYLKKSPQYKTLTIQIDLLSEELLAYKNAGRKDLFEKTQEMLKELTVTRSKFVKLYKEKDWKSEKEAVNEKISTSPLLKELKLKRKELELQYSLINPASLVAKVREFREMLNINDKFNDFTSVIDIDDVIVDIDDVIDDTNFTFQQQYDNLCGVISDLIHISVKEIQEMSTNNILKALKVEVEEEEIQKIKDALEQIKFDTSTEMSKIRGAEDITNVMYDIFDFEIVDEKQPKEMLAAANIGYVKAVAYNQCRKLNMIRNYDDATAYGLMGLTVAINAWYKIQKIKDSPVSFTGFANQYVTNAIKRGLYELGTSGTISPSVVANMIFYRKQKFDNFLKTNPELKDVPKEIIESLIDGLEDKPKYIPSVTTESDINGNIGEGQEIESDYWANSTKSDLNDETFIEIKHEYEHLLKSLKDLFGMFQTKVDKETGIKFETEYKIFDKYDYKLFRLLYGLEFKREALNEKKTSVNNLHTQEEMGVILANYYKANGIPCEPLSQPAIADRKLKLDKKLKAIMEENPSIKAGLQRLMYFCEANRTTIQSLSNKREEAEITKDRMELSEVYVNNAREMNKILSDGKRLSDVYDASTDNPLDDQISQAFRNY